MNLEYDSLLTSPESLEKLCNCTECCTCGEKNIHEWTWDETLTGTTFRLSEDNLEVKFHPFYSNGTAAIRGNQLMKKGRHYYWEVKMLSLIYGTDVMVGVGTSKAEMNAINKYCSLLGHDRESWGLSYKGFIQHNGESKNYAPRFGKGSVIGIHLDTWRGTLQFFLNRKPLGIAFTGLQGVELYPMACSTSAKSKMRITQSCSVPVSLQMECLAMLKPLHRSYLSAAFPGLRDMFNSIFADVLRHRQNCNGDDDEDYEYYFPEEYLILDDFDFALIGYGRRRKKKKRMEIQSSSNAKCVKLS
ncbi:SPRY domain-containing SOCS box protein 3-like [Chelonus insularis]|uniref:SPRY domain-containing SOCS box protein 3-like n=1 Tax=Chelonus insularis TaxID=460826 RepID=UPI00158C125B|nr:SPRY domain-containing SOCS box protein 3-like [Chelonus insularis]XP_034950301.1 SPRY domain-containing SOCS box protein 3-like [Chelonus insularis]